MPLEFSPGDHTWSFGHHFLVGLSGTTLSRRDKDLLRRLRPLGVVLQRRNFVGSPLGHPAPYDVWLPQLRHLLSEAVKYSEREKLLVAIRHEGGALLTAPLPLSPIPSPAAYRTRVTEVAELLCMELPAIGVNLLLGPQLHIAEAQDPYAEHALGSSADEVSERAYEFIHALSAGGIVCCPGPFPAPAERVLPRTFEELSARELIPFARLSATEMKAVTVSRGAFPAAGSPMPALASELLVRGVLREEFGFTGIAISEDLDTPQLAAMLTTDEMWNGILRAGTDLLLVSGRLGDAGHALSYAKHFVRALLQRVIDEDQLHESFQRIERFDATLPSPQVVELPSEALRINRQLAEELRREAAEKHPPRPLSLPGR